LPRIARATDNQVKFVICVVPTMNGAGEDVGA
jgi:hypothetical protein